MKTKNRYQQMLCTYIQRREALKQRFPNAHNNHNGGCPEYRKRVKRIQGRINTMRQQLKRIEQREQQVYQLARDVADFMELTLEMQQGKIKPLMNSIGNTNKRVVISRLMFYKYAMESGIQGVVLSDWVGAKDPCTACRGRLAFTRSFKTKPENLELWRRFKSFIQLKDGSLNSLSRAA